MSARPHAPVTVDAVVVGAGFAGLYQLHRLRGLGFTMRVFERGGGVDGTWYWNRYPGARCDVESMQYSYSFDEALQQEWHWPEKYSAQPDILAYAGEWKQDYVQRRAEMRYAPHGSLKDLNDAPAQSASEAEREAIYQRRWDTGGVGRYRCTCEEVVAHGYRGFCFESRRDAVAAE